MVSRLHKLLITPVAALALVVPGGLAQATDDSAGGAPEERTDSNEEVRERPTAEPQAAPPADPESKTGEWEESPTGLWIVQLEEPPLALYDGGTKGLRGTSTRATGDVRLDVRSARSTAYTKHLGEQQRHARGQIADAVGREVEPEATYSYALNGMTLALSGEEAAAVADLPEVAAVWPDEEWELDTDVSMDLVSASQVWDGDTGSGVGTRGEGLIVGMLDSGVNPDHPSFAATDGEGYTHTNPYGEGVYKGVCAEGAPDHQDICNDKLVGVYTFLAGSPIDDDGHGSHTGSTMAGNVHDAVFDQGATTFTRRISGVAPRANVISYRVCSVLCPSSASVAAVNQAIADGTDVLNFSISGPDNPWGNPVDQAFLAAYEAGIFVSASAGNNGPGPGTVAKTAPWNATVGATNSTRLIAHDLDVVDGPEEVTDLTGVPGVGPAITSRITAPLRYADSVASGNGQGCEAFPAESLAGAMVLIERGECNFSVKVSNAQNAGALAAVVYNQFEGPPVVMGGLETSRIPAVMISNGQGEVLRDHLVANPDAEGTIGPETVESFEDAWASAVTDFSSRGPSSFDLLAPTFTAPGRGILAAADASDGESATYEFMQGTSMSAPHGSGAAALIMALHPEWSPAMVRSALASSADPTGMVKEDGATPADPFDVGSGAMDVGAASRVGLVMDETHANFVAANPATGGDPKTLNLPAVVDDSCLDVCTFERTVTNVSGADTAYTVGTEAAGGMAVTVSPDAFTIPAGGTQTLAVSVDVSGAAGSTWHFGDIRLDTDGTHPGGEEITDVHYPVVAYAAAAELSVAPTEITSTQDVAQVTEHSVLVTNAGGAPATWEIAQDGACALPDWVSVDPASGTIEAGGEQTLAVTFDSTGMVDGGTFEATLCVASNDPQNPLLEVALSMTVVPEPVADVDPGELSATLETYDVQEQTLTVSNPGWGVLDWTFEDPEAGPSDQRIELLREGVLLVPNSSTGQRAVMAFDPEDGSLIDPNFIPYPNFLPGESLYTPLHALPTLDGNGFLVSDQVQGVISQYDLSGNFVGVFSPRSGVEERSQMANIRGMAWSPEDTLLVTVAIGDNGNSVVELSAEGEYLGTRVEPGFDGLSGPWFVHFRDEDMLVGGSGATSRAVHSFSHDGQTANARFAAPLYWPEQIQETPEGNVLVANLSANTATGSISGVYEYSPTGEELGRYTIARNNSFAGAYPLGNGNILTTTNTGVWELARDGSATQEFSGGRGRFISLAHLPEAMPCSTPDEIPWLDLEPGTGSTSYGQSTELTARFDSSGLEPGEYEALLCMSSNDPDQPLVQVPVSMTVAPPACDVTIDGTHSGRLAVGSGRTCLAPGSVVDGPVQVSGDGRLYGDGATINGPVQSSGSGGVMLIGSTVDGRVSITGAQVAVVLDGNTIDGATTVDRNDTGIRPIVVSDNTIEGRLGCSGNEPPPTDLGSPNAAGNKGGQCRDL